MGESVEAHEQVEKPSDSTLLASTRHVMDLAYSIDAVHPELDTIKDPKAQDAAAEKLDREAIKNQAKLKIYLDKNFPPDVAELLAGKVKEKVLRLRGLKDALENGISDPRFTAKAIYESVLEEVNGDIDYSEHAPYGSSAQTYVMYECILEAAKGRGNDAARSLAQNIIRYRSSAESYITAKLRLADVEGDDKASALVRKGMRAVKQMAREEERGSNR